MCEVLQRGKFVLMVLLSEVIHELKFLKNMNIKMNTS